MFTRRKILQASAAAGLLVSGGMLARRARADGTPTATSSVKRPRYFVTIFLRGGIDAVYTTDPKTRADVEQRCDVPYDANAIVDAGGKMQFGPHFKPLTKYAEQMAILRGVQVSTANHETGAYQVLRMRTAVEPMMPSLHDIIGQRRDGQPLSAVTIGNLAAFEYSPGSVIAPTGIANDDAVTSLEAIDGLSDEDVALLATTYKKHLAAFPSHLSGRDELTRDHVQQVAGFFDKAKDFPRFSAEKWGTTNPEARRAADDLQRTLWFLEHDLTKSVMCKIQFDWDSHYRNADKQTLATGDFTAILKHFIDGLHERRNAFGTLAEQTLVVVTSELGRFPVINGNLGKDHFPEVQMVLMGPGINVGNAFVPTGKVMDGKKIDFKTGKPSDTGAHVFLDDVGTTLLSLAGVNPELYGYSGRHLDFLVRA